MNHKIMLFLTLMLSGRAMTLAFIQRAGGALQGDPPAAWLMPLIGDAVIGVSALWIAYIILKKQGLWVWTSIVVWNALAIWDALSAYIVNISNPWPEFFMLQAVGSSMFFAASAMHLAIIFLACQKSTRKNLVGQ